MQAVKNRNMGVQVLLMIVTFGLYSVYWFYQVCSEMKLITKNEEISPMLWTVLLFVPFGPLYSYYQFSIVYEKFGSEKVNRWILFILWLFFAPAIWFMVQRDLNRISIQGLPSADGALT